MTHIKTVLCVGCLTAALAAPVHADGDVEVSMCNMMSPAMSFTDTMAEHVETVGPLAVLPAALAAVGGALNGWVIQPIDAATTEEANTCADSVVVVQ